MAFTTSVMSQCDNEISEFDYVNEDEPCDTAVIDSAQYYITTAHLITLEDTHFLNVLGKAVKATTIFNGVVAFNYETNIFEYVSLETLENEMYELYLQQLEFKGCQYGK